MKRGNFGFGILKTSTLEFLSQKAKLVSKVFDQMETIEYNKLNYIIKELIKIKTKATRTTVIKCLVGFFSNDSQFRQTEAIEDAILGVINLFIRQTQGGIHGLSGPRSKPRLRTRSVESWTKVEAEFGKTVLMIFGKLQENSYFDCLQMFTMGVLVTMSEMSRYKQAALKLLKNIVSKSQQLQTLRKNSSWLVRYRFHSFAANHIEVMSRPITNRAQNLKSV